MQAGKILRTTSITVETYFDIVAGPPALLTVKSHASFGSIAGMYGDEAAVLKPHPAGIFLCMVWWVRCCCKRSG
jgi:hypothetical protein